MPRMSDPYELQDLGRSSAPEHVAELEKWKQKMAQQFLEEGRDKYGFVSADGRTLLGASFRNLTGKSPNYPASSPAGGAGAGDCDAATVATLKVDSAVIARSGGQQSASCEGFTWVPQSRSLVRPAEWQPEGSFQQR
jgi:hypothetical protein|eukprot:SAG25_NODE_455_length_7865_cov_2.578032_3_plen_137_part_00